MDTTEDSILNGDITTPQMAVEDATENKSHNKIKKNLPASMLTPNSPFHNLIDTKDLPRYAKPTVSYQLRVSLAHCQDENLPTNLPTCSRYRLDIPDCIDSLTTQERRSRSVEPSLNRPHHLDRMMDRHNRTPRVTKRCTSSAALTSSTFPSPSDHTLSSTPNKYLKSRLNKSQASEDEMDKKSSTASRRNFSASVDKMHRSTATSTLASTTTPIKSTSHENVLRKRATSADRFLEKRLGRKNGNTTKPPIPPSTSMSRSFNVHSLKSKKETKSASSTSIKDKLIAQSKDVINKITTSDSKHDETKNNELNSKHNETMRKITSTSIGKSKVRDELNDSSIHSKTKHVENKEKVKVQGHSAKPGRPIENIYKPGEDKSHESKIKLGGEFKAKPNATIEGKIGEDDKVEEYKAKLAEKRKLAREKQEKEAEDEKANQLRIKEIEAERQRQEEAAEERRIEEEMHLADDARLMEQQRLEQLTREETQRKQIEVEKLEKEAQLKREQEKLAKEEAERVEQARLIRIKKEKSTDCDSALIQLLCVHG